MKRYRPGAYGGMIEDADGKYVHVSDLDSSVVATPVHQEEQEHGGTSLTAVEAVSGVVPTDSAPHDVRKVGVSEYVMKKPRPLWLYNPQHDYECQLNHCFECGEDAEGAHKGHSFSTSSLCTCGCDQAIEAAVFARPRWESKEINDLLENASVITSESREIIKASIDGEYVVGETGLHNALDDLLRLAIHLRAASARYPVGSGNQAAKEQAASTHRSAALKNSNELAHEGLEQAKKELVSTINALVNHARLRGSEAVVCLPEDYMDEIDALLLASRQQAEQEIERLRLEIEALTNAGVIECAVRNRSVAEYMDHWEGRTLKAESKLAALPAEIDQMLTSTYPEKWNLPLSEVRDRLRAFFAESNQSNGDGRGAA